MLEHRVSGDMYIHVRPGVAQQLKIVSMECIGQASMLWSCINVGVGHSEAKGKGEDCYVVCKGYMTVEQLR